MTSRTIALAADSMEPRLLAQWIQSGDLPNLAALREDGVGGVLDCTIPEGKTHISSAVQWTTHFTGVGLDRHGVYGFRKERSASDGSPSVKELINISDVPVKTYPELLDERGYSVGLVNPLPVWPPLEFESGFCVSGMLTPPESDRWVHPGSLAGELRELGYRIDVKYPDRPYGFIDDDLFEEVSIDTLYADMFEVLDARVAATKHLFETRETDYLYVLLKSVDIIQHVFWAHMEANDLEYGDAILESYRRVDELVGWVREHAPRADLLLFSDHGGRRRPVYRSNVVTRLAEGVASLLPPVPQPIREWYDRYKTVETGGPGNANGTGNGSGDVLGNPGRKTGIHRDEAVWMMAGPSVQASDADVRLRFEDVTPTILALLEQPIPSDYVGSPATGSLRVDPTYVDVDLRIDRRAELTIRDHERVSERLHNLGYAEMVDE
jgi:predicted AlkP superfamily phosphohydrolase/phosphomutase